MTFRSLKQIDQMTYFRWTDPTTNVEVLPYNDFIIIIRIWSDFKKVTFYYYRERERPDT